MLENLDQLKAEAKKRAGEVSAGIRERVESAKERIAPADSQAADDPEPAADSGVGTNSAAAKKWNPFHDRPSRRTVVSGIVAIAILPVCLTAPFAVKRWLEPRIDTSSEQALVMSVQKVLHGVPQDEQDQLKRDMIFVVRLHGKEDLLDRYGKIFFASLAGSEFDEAGMFRDQEKMAPLNGSTAAQIRDRAAALRTRVKQAMK